MVGLAYKSAMCYGKYSVGVVQDRRPTLAAVGTTAAHEMGHILGMSHDELDGSKIDVKINACLIKFRGLATYIA